MTDIALVPCQTCSFAAELSFNEPYTLGSDNKKWQSVFVMCTACSASVEIEFHANNRGMKRKAKNAAQVSWNEINAEEG